MLNRKAIIYDELLVEHLGQAYKQQSVNDWNFLPKMQFGSLFTKIGGSNCSFNAIFIIELDLKVLLV